MARLSRSKQNLISIWTILTCIFKRKPFYIVAFTPDPPSHAGYYLIWLPEKGSPVLQYYKKGIKYFGDGKTLAVSAYVGQGQDY